MMKPAPAAHPDTCHLDEAGEHEFRALIASGILGAALGYLLGSLINASRARTRHAEELYRRAHVQAIRARMGAAEARMLAAEALQVANPPPVATPATAAAPAQ